jgi:uncharacterized protein (TIGR00299 family) protein
MKLCYLDCFSGISGDMLLGALVDSGLPAETLEGELRKLPLSGWKLRIERVRRGGLTATKLDFDIEEAHHHRTWENIRDTIRTSELSAGVQGRSEAIFARLAEVEGAVHGVDPEKVHFHEVGALDSILDIVGVSIALETLGIERVAASALNVGTGTVKTDHGVLPVPAPATAALLQGAPVYSSGAEGELVTPTGAAILATEASQYGALPQMRVQAIGYGAGSHNPKGYPNVLRVMLGEAMEAGQGTEEPEVAVLEANLDDMSPEIGGYFMEEALAAGALDVFYTPVQMKKNRPGTLLTVVCPPDRADALSELIFSQTTTIGLRSYRAQRQILNRSCVTVDSPLGRIRVKVSELNGRVVNAAPEYEDCQKVAREKGVPLKQVLAEAMYCFQKQQEEGG